MNYLLVEVTHGATGCRSGSPVLIWRRPKVDERATVDGCRVEWIARFHLRSECYPNSGCGRSDETSINDLPLITDHLRPQREIEHRILDEISIRCKGCVIACHDGGSTSPGMNNNTSACFP